MSENENGNDPAWPGSQSDPAEGAPPTSPPPPPPGAPPPPPGGTAPPPPSGTALPPPSGTAPPPSQPTFTPGGPIGGPPAPVKKQGRGRGVLVRVVIGLVVFGGLGIFGALTAADRGEDGEIVDGGTLGADELQLGDCLSDPGDGEFDTVEAVPCTEPHDQEVYHVADLPQPAGADYPGDDPVFEQAALLCYDAWPAFVGRSYETSVLDFVVATPTRAAWNLDDREFACFVYDPSGPTTGTLRGADR